MAMERHNFPAAAAGGKGGGGVERLQSCRILLGALLHPQKQLPQGTSWHPITLP